MTVLVEEFDYAIIEDAHGKFVYTADGDIVDV